MSPLVVASITGFLVFCTVMTFAAWLVVSLRRFAARLARRFLLLSRTTQAALVFAVGVATVSAQKNGTGVAVSHTEARRHGASVVHSKTKSVSLASSAESVQIESPQWNCITSNDVVRGYAFVEARTNDTTTYEMPSGGTVVGTWHLTGAHDDVVRVSFSTADAGLYVCGTSFWAHTWGKVRPRLRDGEHEIVAVGSPMSVSPGEGRLWTATTAGGSLLLTWEGFVLGRRRISEASGDEPPTISAQFEFFSNGGFVARSNEVERVYRRVNPDDWDDDGIENEKDDDPLVAADSPAFGPRQTLPGGASASAYYWIDLVVPHANAKVSFAGEGASDLEDPSFVAKAGETNRVTLLVGKPYAVTCALPFEIAGVSDGAEVLTREDGRSARVCWPVAISSADGSGSLFEMAVQPSDLGGTFFWTNSCCGVSLKDGLHSFLCANGACRCTGCSAIGFYQYEGFSIACGGGTCGCLPSGGPPQEAAPASVSVIFSKNAVIFEDEYESSDGVFVPRRSTRTTLVCSANGGASGGVAMFEVDGMPRLSKVSGLSLPFSRRLGSNEAFSTRIVYEGQAGGGCQPKASATFVSNDPGTTNLAASASLTVAQVEIVVHRRPSANESANRHRFGVCEVLSCNSYPSGTGLQWTSSGGQFLDANHNYQCPAGAATNPLKATCGDAEFVPMITVVEPDGAEGRNPQCVTYGVSAGRAGWVGLCQDVHVKPLDVSFEWIMMEEVPCTSGARSGYFDRASFASLGSHSEANGAGVWCPVGTDNRMGDCDIARITTELMRVDASGDFTEDETCGWMDGWIAWDVPFGWSPVLTAVRHSDTKPERVFDSNAAHRFAITAEGSVTVEKFGNTARRDIDGSTYCNEAENEGGL